MSKIPDQTLAEIQQRCNIVDLIGQYVPLKKAGRNFKALCPFHHEKTPSFTVNPDKQIFHCFGCGVGGDVFAFIIKQERLEFPEAVRMLADRCGVLLERRPETERGPGVSQAAALSKVNELAARFFEAQLAKSPAAAAARAYVQTRGITEETSRVFRLGYALPGWDSLRLFLQARRVPEPLQEASGLVVCGSQGKKYDRFRNRLIFPITNAQGAVVGFGGRVVPDPEGGSGPDAGQPKYVNSPETALYSKGRILYGLQAAKAEISRHDTALVVEGYLDQIMPYQAGVRNIVASLGTAFTAEQARLLRRYTRTVVLLYDADTAGQDASLRSLEMLLAEGMDVRIASLPEGEDPDTYVRRFGADALRKVAEQARSLFDFSLTMYQRKFRGKTPEAARRVVDAMMGLVRQVHEPVLRSLYMRRLSEALHVPEPLLYRELRGSERPAEPSREAPVTRRATSAEHLLVMLLVSDPQRIEAARQGVAWQDLQDPAVRDIARLLYEQQSPVSAAMLMQRLTSEQARRVLAEVLAADWGVGDADADAEKTFAECIRRVQAECLSRRREKVLHELKDIASPLGEAERINRLQREYGRLTKELHAYGKASKGKS